MPDTPKLPLSKMRKITREIVSGVIESSDGYILFGLQKANGVYADCWHIPGGGQDPGESYLETLFREIQEETGLDIVSLDHKIVLLDDTQTGESTKYKNGEWLAVSMNFHDYHVVLDLPHDQLPVLPNDDMLELRWVLKKDLKSIQLTPPSINLFSRLGWLN